MDSSSLIVFSLTQRGLAGKHYQVGKSTPEALRRRVIANSLFLCYKRILSTGGTHLQNKETLMIKRTLIVIALFALLLTGCVTPRVETKIKKDGSGTKSFLVAVDKNMMSMVESMAEHPDTSGQDLWESARSSAASRGPR
jgi:hypothetical protein